MGLLFTAEDPRFRHETVGQDLDDLAALLLEPSPQRSSMNDGTHH